MASENETFDEVLRCTQNDIVHFVGKPVKHSRDLLQEYHDRFKAAHHREVAELKRRIKEALAIASDIDKCASIERHTDAMLKKNEVIVGLRKEIAELRACLKMAYGDKIGTYTMKGNEVERWRKALREEGGAK